MASAIAQPLPESARPARARPLKWLVWGFCLLLVAGIWWFVVAQTAFERQLAIDDAIIQNNNRAIAFEQYVRRTLEAADLVTRYVGNRYARGDVGSEFRGVPGRPAIISGNVARNGTFLSVNVLDPEGNVVATSIARPLPGINFANHPAFRTHLGRDDGRLHVSRPVYAPLVNQNVIWLTRRLNHPDGSFAGVIGINILPEQFTAFYRDAEVNPQDVMVVTGLDGVVRARRIGGTSTSGEETRNGPITRAQIGGQTSGTALIASPRDRVMRYVSHRRLSDYPLFVAYGVPEAEVLAPRLPRARIFFAGAGLLSLLLIAFATLFTVLLDRRERRAAEMEATNRRLREAQRIGQIGDWHYDLGSGETVWSPQLLAMYERETLGSPTFEEFMSFLTPDGQAAIDQVHAEAIRTGAAQEVEYAIRLPSGTESYHWSAVIPELDANGKTLALHGTDQDISARKELDRLQTHVAHLSRLEAMNAMAATLAHELNQPLTSASNYLSGSRRRLRSDGEDALDETEEGLAAAEQQVHLAADIIRRVRDMVSNRPKAVVVASLSRIVDDAVALIAMASPSAKVNVVKRIAPDARTVRGDRIQLQQVMINLLRNSVDATEGLAAPEIVVTSRSDGAGGIVICVSDNGAGFSQPERERFSPFATTKESGLGLGLSISRTIIESHGGRIWTEEPEKDGARVCFTLPAPRRQADREGGERGKG
ncbi:MAG TPA: ATP-binding protein [Allosphingosinicella sp.]|nr:ATP-binding protein [Allosphingosinicella sp.]